MASMNFGGAFDTLASDDFWIDAAMVFGGFLLPTILANVIEGQLDTDLPNELYGIGTAAGVEMVGGKDYRMVAVGGGVYTGDVLATRLDVKQKVTKMGA